MGETKREESSTLTAEEEAELKEACNISSNMVSEVIQLAYLKMSGFSELSIMAALNGIGTGLIMASTITMPPGGREEALTEIVSDVRRGWAEWDESEGSC